MSELHNEEYIIKASFLSTIGKWKKTILTLQRKGASIALAERRLSAYRVGFAVLFPDGSSYCSDELREVQNVFLPWNNLVPGSPQRTLLERRMSSMCEAIGAIDELIGEHTV